MRVLVAGAVVGAVGDVGLETLQVAVHPAEIGIRLVQCPLVSEEVLVGTEIPGGAIAYLRLHCHHLRLHCHHLTLTT